MTARGAEVGVVTGAARGIGRAIAERLGADGLRLVLVDLDDAVEETAQRVIAAGGDAVGLRASVTSDAGRAAVRAAVGGAPLRALVNNAGITRDGLLASMEEDDFLAVIDVNLGAAHELIGTLRPLFADGAAIVNMSSRAYLGNPGQFNYTASKGGLVGLTRALGQELAPRVRVNALAPGLTATEMTRAMPERVLDKLVSRIPTGRMAQPAEIAAAVALLISPDASYLTGQVLLVCGGRSLAHA